MRTKTARLAGACRSRQNDYCRHVHRTLHAIAGMKLRSGDTLSVTAVALKLIDGPDPLVMRQAVHDGCQLLVDMGIASHVLDPNGRRTTTLLQFHEDFGPDEPRAACAWDGRDHDQHQQEDQT